MAKESKSIGVDVDFPSVSCEDINCPFHGELKVRGRTFVGTVTSSKPHKTVTVSWERTHFIPKYERYEKRSTKIHAHNPPCINAKEGEVVKIIETRPLSKTKNFVVIQKLGMAKKKEETEDETRKSKSN